MKRIICFFLAIIILLPVMVGCSSGELNAVEKERQKQIKYEAAVRHLRQEKYEEAIEEFLNLGNYKDAPTRAIYCEALSYCAVGDYVSAYEVLTEIPTYDDTAQLLKEIYYETRLFEGLNDYRKNLKNPGSLTLADVQFAYKMQNIDKPSIIAKISAQNGFGGYSMSYCWIVETDGVYGYAGSCDSLDMDDYKGKTDKIIEALICAGISTMLNDGKEITDAIDIDRVQSIINKGNYGSIKRVKELTYDQLNTEISVK